ncbi:hypothetical protein TNCV_4549501 [Trichonephila clavipes]|nr:hypothetical protein TNCV_4549501 [Trichonephila clavipes]
MSERLKIFQYDCKDLLPTTDNRSNETHDIERRTWQREERRRKGEKKERVAKKRWSEKEDTAGGYDHFGLEFPPEQLAPSFANPFNLGNGTSLNFSAHLKLDVCSRVITPPRGAPHSLRNTALTNVEAIR